MLYRIHDRLLVDSRNGTFIEPGEGCVHPLGMIGKAAIAMLLNSGAISLVEAPPLDVFTGWSGRARTLGALGIDTVGLVVMDARDVSYAICASKRGETQTQEAFNVRVDKLAIAVTRWQYEIKEALGIGDALTRR